MGNKQNGQTLLEVLVAIAIGIFVVAALTFATIFSLRNANFAKTSAQATKLAQEGIERVRTGRDRNSSVTNLDASVKSWKGDGTAGSAIWDYRITGAGLCDNPPTGKCYFNVDSTGLLNNIGFGQTSFPLSAQGIPSAKPVFRRAVILSDESGTYQTEKKVTVVVTWKDATGEHESRLTTILGKI